MNAPVSTWHWKVEGDSVEVKLNVGVLSLVGVVIGVSVVFGGVVSTVKVHEAGNKSFTWEFANGELDAAFRDAAVVIERTYRQQRLIPSAMEPRAVVCAPVGRKPGRNQPISAIVAMYIVIARMPGMMPAMNSLPMSCSVMMP